jgi:mRNA interferase MazF
MAGGIIKRSDFVVVVIPGDYGKARPALVVHSNLFAGLPSATVCPLTTTRRDDAGLLRITVEPDPSVNGLRERSQIAIDKITTIPLAKIGGVIGHADDAPMVTVTRALALYLGIA